MGRKDVWLTEEQLLRLPFSCSAFRPASFGQLSLVPLHLQVGVPSAVGMAGAPAASGALPGSAGSSRPVSGCHPFLSSSSHGRGPVSATSRLNGVSICVHNLYVVEKKKRRENLKILG